MNSLKKLSLVFSILAPLAGCASANDGNAPPDDTFLSADAPAPAADEDNAALGYGADTNRHMVVRQQCLVPTSTNETGKQIGDLTMELDSNRARIEKSLEVNASAKVGPVSATTRFLEESKEDELSTVFMFDTSIQFKSQQVGEWRLGSNVASITDPLKFEDTCGDAYVSKLYRGASLYAMVKVQYQSKEEKQTVQAELKGKTAWIDASASFKNVVERKNIKVAVRVKALQIGGQPEKLGQMIDADGKSCSGGDLGGCLGYVDAVQKYSRDSFGKQFDVGTIDELTRRAAITGYETTTWPTSSVPALDVLTFANPTAKKVNDAFVAQTSDVHAANGILNLSDEIDGRSPAMAEKQGARIRGEVRPLLDKNRSKLVSAFRKCIDDETPECLTAASSALATLEKVDAKNDLVPWFDATDDDGKPAPADELLDVDGDGRPDYCRRDVTPTGFVQVVCQMGVGGGFSPDRYAVMSPAFTKWQKSGISTTAPTVVIDLGGHPAICQARSEKDASAVAPAAFCITSNGKYDAVMSFERGIDHGDMENPGWGGYDWEGRSTWKGSPAELVKRIAAALQKKNGWPYTQQ